MKNIPVIAISEKTLAEAYEAEGQILQKIKNYDQCH